jgi:hypothetical protein
MDSNFQFRDASPQPTASARSFGGEWRPLERRQQLYRFAEADDCSDETPHRRVDRPQLGRSLETAAYLSAELKVRIQFPPAESQQTFGSSQDDACSSIA